MASADLAVERQVGPHGEHRDGCVVRLHVRNKRRGGDKKEGNYIKYAVQASARGEKGPMPGCVGLDY